MLVDDHVVMRQGLAWLLRGGTDVEIVGEASDGESAVSLARPDVILMDVRMPIMGGVDAGIAEPVKGSRKTYSILARGRVRLDEIVSL